MPQFLPEPGDDGDRRECRRCGQPVDPTLRRVAGHDGVVECCPNCTTAREAIADGGAAGLETRDVGNQGGYDGV